jgi:hypothetical protein
MDEVFIILPQGKQEQNTAKKEKRKNQRSGRRKELAHSPNAATIKACQWWWWVQDLLCKCVSSVRGAYWTMKTH